MPARRTKIVATLGPATDPPGVLDRLVAAGIDCARLNCSHGTHDDLRRRAREVREASERAGRPLSLLFDLQGPKIRLAADTAEQELEIGAAVTLVGTYGDMDAETCLRVEFAGFTDLVTARSHIVIGDGVPRLACERVDGDRVRARVLAAGTLGPRKGVNVTHAQPSLPAITDKDIADLELAVEEGADFVALSFVRSAADLEELRDRLRDHGAPARTVAKIEKVEAYEALDDIINVADGVMVARGDLGIEAGVARVPLIQKDTIRRATHAGKLVITATQMLESMITAPEPTRAEAADVANAVIDGTSAVMLSAETSVGRHPVAAVRSMAQIAQAAEEAPILSGMPPRDPGTTSGAVMHAAIELAEELEADALIVPTSTGGAARACSKFRYQKPVIALAHTVRVANQLALEWGVQPAVMEYANTVDELIDEALVRARDAGRLPDGATVVLTAGRRTGTPGATNLIMVREIPART
jgi:pyruvate kinase